MTASKIGEQIPAGGEMTDIEKDLIGVLQNRVNDYLKYMNDLEFRKALKRAACRLGRRKQLHFDH